MGNTSENGVAPAAIIGGDVRLRINPTDVAPYSGTVWIKAVFPDDTYKEGSGFMIGPSAVVTAAHCLYVKAEGNNPAMTAESITIVPAKNGSERPYGSTTAESFTLCSNYPSNNGKDDWAIIELNHALGYQTGWLPLRTQTTTYNDTFVYNTGYPSPETTAGQVSDRYMFRGTGFVRSTQTYLIKGDWDATAGNSGGPVYAYYSDTGYTIIGILTSGSGTQYDGSDYPTAFTTATRITQEMYDLFSTYQ